MKILGKINGKMVEMEFEGENAGALFVDGKEDRQIERDFRSNFKEKDLRFLEYLGKLRNTKKSEK